MANVGAMYISIEHRYYGESLPFAEFTAANLQWLSSQQALADTANFIEQHNQTLSNPGPVLCPRGSVQNTQIL